MKTYKAGELREDMLVVPAYMLEGFVLVPVEPTTEMLLSAMQYDRGQSPEEDPDLAESLRIDWSLMLAAAPKGDSHE